MDILFQRNLIDGLCRKTKEAPLPGEVNYTDAIDLGSIDPAGERHTILVAEVIFSEAAALGDGKNIVATLYHSDTESGYTATDPQITVTITGAGGVGAAALSSRFVIPPEVKRYIVLKLEADAGDPGSSGSTVTFQLLF